MFNDHYIVHILCICFRYAVTGFISGDQTETEKGVQTGNVKQS